MRGTSTTLNFVSLNGFSGPSRVLSYKQLTKALIPSSGHNYSYSQTLRVFFVYVLKEPLHRELESTFHTGDFYSSVWCQCFVTVVRLSALVHVYCLDSIGWQRAVKGLLWTRVGGRGDGPYWRKREQQWRHTSETVSLTKTILY